MEKQVFRIEPFIDHRPDKGQDALLANYLELIDSMQLNADAANEMGHNGFDAKKLSEGILLCQEAQAALVVLTAALDAQQLIEARLARAFPSAGQNFIEYRDIAQKLVTDGASQYLFCSNGKVPPGLVDFIAYAHSAYKVAYNSQSFLTKLQQFGDLRCLFDIGISSMKELISTDKANEEAKAVVIDAKIAFDEAMKRVKRWMKAFRKGTI